MPELRIIRRMPLGAVLALSLALLLVVPASGHAADVKLFPVPSADAGLDEIVAGSDGYLWFLNDIGSSVYRISTGGRPIRSTTTSSNASNLASSAASGIWLTLAHGTGYDDEGDGLIRLDVGTGTAYRYSATYLDSHAMTLGPNGAMWYTDGGDYLKRVTDAGEQVNHPIGNSDPTDEVFSMAFGPGGVLWFTEFTPGSSFSSARDGAVGSLNPDGEVSISDLGDQGRPGPLDDPLPRSIVAGADGSMYFATNQGIGRVTRSGRVEPASLAPYDPAAIAFGSDGNLWFVDTGANQIGRVSVASLPFAGPGTPGGNRVKIASKSLNYKQNKVKVKIKCLGSGQCKGKLQLKQGKKTKLAKGSYKLPAGKQKNATTMPTKQGKRQLKRAKGKLKVTVELKPSGGGKKVTKKLKLKG